MLPLCSATPTCSSHLTQVTIQGGSFLKECVLDKRVLGLPTKPNATKSLYTNSLTSLELKYVVDDGISQNDDVLTGLSVPQPKTVPPPLDLKSSLDEFVSGVTTSFGDSTSRVENALKSSVGTIDSFVSSVIKSANDAVDRAGESAGNKAASFSSDLKDTAVRAALFGVDVLRRTVVAVEDSFANGASFVVYSYQSAKQAIPPEIRDGLNLYEDKANSILSPAKIVFQKVYVGIEGLETSLGLDPSDPLVPFALLLVTSAALWVFYWVLTYSGYAGDLSPRLALEILSGKENALLIDIRPEVLRERDGIPDLRRAARFRYASVAVPEVGGSQRNLLKNVRELEDALTAAVIRNLKIAQDRSKVLVLDADESRSKGVARSLQKLGVKEAYLVQGGFRSWVKEGLRIKELKPETTLTILNEEAEAILEDIKPSPLQVLGFGVGLIAASYALLEWETTLQYVGVIGLGQTVFRRIASYEGAEDFKKDVGLLLTPARIGSQAFAWATGKLDINRVGLPTSPSSTDVQNRVLQAAAKHESQPSEAEGVKDQSPGSTTIPLSEKVDLSEA